MYLALANPCTNHAFTQNPANVVFHISFWLSNGAGLQSHPYFLLLVAADVLSRCQL
jgi:hypothetical protein